MCHVAYFDRCAQNENRKQITRKEAPDRTDVMLCQGRLHFASQKNLSTGPDQISLGFAKIGVPLTAAKPKALQTGGQLEKN